MKELIKKIVIQLTEEQLKTVQKNIDSDKEIWGDYANLNIDEFIEDCQEFHDTKEITVEDVMKFAQIDWRMNEGL